jgi:hypothetical protein
MMHLESVEKSLAGLQATYTVKHSTPGGHGTTLSADLVLTLDPRTGTQTSCRIEIADCEGDNPQESLERMSSWLRRLADGIDDHQEISIPI